ncbi:uncharacterized protein LOC144664022 [Oculina patagonica]
MDEETVMSADEVISDEELEVKYSRRNCKRTFVFLEGSVSRAPSLSAKAWKDLESRGRVGELTFQKGNSADELGRLMLARFPLLLGEDLRRLVFLTSNDSGRAMVLVSKGLMNGVEILKEFTSSGSKRKKVFFYMDHGNSASHLQTKTSTSKLAKKSVHQRPGATSTRTSAVDQVDLVTPPRNGSEFSLCSQV